MQKRTHENGVVYFTSDLIKVPHAFATRLGGVSTEPHTCSLNLAFGRGDEDIVVLENLRRFGDAAGFCAENAVSMPQIHSNCVIYVSRDMAGAGYFEPHTTECDGYVTRERGIAVGVRTADCVPILLADEHSGVIGALHAGWRGTFSDICAEGIQEMLEAGADLSHIKAAIGPSICRDCYEVGEDVYDAACLCMGEDADGFFAAGKEKGKYRADLKGANRYLLIRAGVDPDNIDVSELCTFESPDLFWSHRLTAGKRGTMLSVIWL